MALLSLPQSLNETYDRILQGLKSAGQLQDAVTALRWLCYSNRPLQLSEMVEILAIENGDDGGFFPEERLPDPADVMVICSSLISYNYVGNDSDNSNDGDLSDNDLRDGSVGGGRATQIQLAHFSVREYLLSDRCALRSDFQTQTCHIAMAEGCLQYLLHLCEKAPLTQEVVDQHPLARYAAEYWWQHAQKLDSTLGCAVFGLAFRLLTDETARLLSWVQLYDVDQPWKGLDLSLTVNNLSQSLYYAASVGVSGVVGDILKLKINVNAQGGRYGNALQAASNGGQEKVVRMLLDAGADVQVEGGEYGSALQAASYGGHGTVVRILLDAGADVQAKGGWYGNALHVASSGGYETLVRMLLDAGADVEAKGGGDYSNALQAASHGGHETVVRMLLDAGADVQAKEGGKYSNALHAASSGGDETVVRILLDAGADIQAKGGGGWYGNALQAASSSGHEKVVRMLLDAGADVQAKEGGEYSNALQAASYGGDEKVVRMLLDAGADIEAKGGGDYW